MSIEQSIENLKAKLNEKEVRAPISFNEFLKYASENPNNVFRNIFQLFSDIIKYYIGVGKDDNPDDPEYINYVKYNCKSLFVEGTDNPYFADTPFANRLVNLAKSFRNGAQRNKIFIFEGPTGSGKSTFLDNLLQKVEEYVNTEEGLTYEIVWRIDKAKIGASRNWKEFMENYNISKMMGNNLNPEMEEVKKFFSSSEPLEVPCPSHDNPILLIPKQFRKDFFNQIIENRDFKEKLFSRKEYDWLFKDEPCTICSSLYQTLLDKLESPSEVFNMIYARKYQFNRRLGEGISVYNPGDTLMKDPIVDHVIQKIINNLFKDSNAVRYVFSVLARTNNGIFSIVDIKSNNKDRIMNLHGIISDNVHKVEHIEEQVHSLFLSLMNPEDKDIVESVKSLGDRIMRIPIPYVLDYFTEVEIYRNKFGRLIDARFLPSVLENFAKVVISSRLNSKSKNLEEWIKDPGKYSKYCDKDLLLLKMDLYTNVIPSWISEEDRENFDAKTRRKIIAESEKDGQDENSISGRESIEIFSDFYSKYAKEGKLIDMSRVYEFFNNKKEYFKKIPEKFLDSLSTLYDYNLLQDIKESLYNYNEKEISKDILNYMFAVNFEIGNTVKCIYTGIELNITEEFLNKIDDKLIRDSKKESKKESKKKFRESVQKEYTSKTLTYEIGVEGMDIKNTSLYKSLLEKYQYNIKKDVLNPFLVNDNFRNAIKDFGTPSFRTYDKNIIRDVKFLLKNLKKKYSYTEEGAKQVCIYVIDNDITKRFSEN